MSKKEKPNAREDVEIVEQQIFLLNVCDKYSEIT